MLLCFCLISLADTKMIYGYNFVAPLNSHKSCFKLLNKFSVRKTWRNSSVNDIMLSHSVLNRNRYIYQKQIYLCIFMESEVRDTIRGKETK